MIEKQIEYKYTCTSGTPQREYVTISMPQYSCRDRIIHDRLRDTVYVADRLRDTVYVADRLRDTEYVAESVSGVHLRDNSQCSVLVSQSVNIDSQSSLY